MQNPYENISAAVLATQAEDRFLEHKETIKYDVRTHQPNPALLDAVIDRVCGFWNAGGGTLLVGVQDRTGTVCGLDRDLKLFKDLDAMVLQVTNKLHNEVSTISAFIHVAPEPADDKLVLRIDTPKGNRPAFRNDRFWLRTNNSTRELKGDGLMTYLASRFPGMYTEPIEPDLDRGAALTAPLDDMKPVAQPSGTDADPNSPFGHWTTTEDRLVELNNRLSAWYISGEQLPELFSEALRKLSMVYDEYEEPWDSDPTSLLQAFEEVLSDFDNVLRHFPEEPPSATEPDS